MSAFARELIEEFRRALREDPTFARELRDMLGAPAPVGGDPTDPVAKPLAARLLGIHQTTLDRAVRHGCPVTRFNGRKRFDMAAVREWFAAQKSKRAPSATTPDNDPINVDHVVRQLGMRRRA